MSKKAIAFIIISTACLTIWICVIWFPPDTTPVRWEDSLNDLMIEEEAEQAAKFWISPNANPYINLRERRLWLNSYIKYREKHPSIGQP